jgi:hypothetical protein
MILTIYQSRIESKEEKYWHPQTQLIQTYIVTDLAMDIDALVRR